MPSHSCFGEWEMLFGRILTTVLTLFRVKEYYWGGRVAQRERGGGGDFGGYLIRKEQCYSLNKYFKKTNSRTGQIHRHASKLICKLTVQFGG